MESFSPPLLHLRIVSSTHHFTSQLKEIKYSPSLNTILSHKALTGFCLRLNIRLKNIDINSISLNPQSARVAAEDHEEQSRTKEQPRSLTDFLLFSLSTPKVTPLSSCFVRGESDENSASLLLSPPTQITKKKSRFKNQVGGVLISQNLIFNINRPFSISPMVITSYFTLDEPQSLAANTRVTYLSFNYFKRTECGVISGLYCVFCCVATASS